MNVIIDSFVIISFLFSSLLIHRNRNIQFPSVESAKNIGKYYSSFLHKEHLYFSCDWCGGAHADERMIS